MGWGFKINRALGMCWMRHTLTQLWNHLQRDVINISWTAPLFMQSKKTWTYWEGLDLRCRFFWVKRVPLLRKCFNVFHCAFQRVPRQRSGARSLNWWSSYQPRKWSSIHHDVNQKGLCSRAQNLGYWQGLWLFALAFSSGSGYRLINCICLQISVSH